MVTRAIGSWAGWGVEAVAEMWAGHIADNEADFGDVDVFLRVDEDVGGPVDPVP